MATLGLDFNKTAERWRRLSEDYLEEARAYFSDVNKSALTVGTFLLGFMGVFIQLGDIQTSPLHERVVLAVAFILTTGSLLLGLWVFRKSNQFLNRSGRNYEKMSERLSDWMLRNGRGSDPKYPDEIYKGLDLTTDSGGALSNSQLLSLGLGFCVLVAYFFLRVF